MTNYFDLLHHVVFVIELCNTTLWRGAGRNGTFTIRRVRPSAIAAVLTSAFDPDWDGRTCFFESEACFPPGNRWLFFVLRPHSGVG